MKPLYPSPLERGSAAVLLAGHQGGRRGEGREFEALLFTFQACDLTQVTWPLGTSISSFASEPPVPLTQISWEDKWGTECPPH